METFSASIADASEQDGVIAPRFVLLGEDRRDYAEAGLFAEYAREDARREISERIEAQNPLAAEMIKRFRENMRWLGVVGHPNNDGPMTLPTLAVSKFDTTIPQHPWSDQADDFVWGAVMAISNPLPGTASVAVEARGRIVATKVLQQGEILWLRESGSSAEREPGQSDDTVEGISQATRVLLAAVDGTVYAANIPDMEPDGRYSSAIEAFVTLERQARTDR